jgi:hypothetical protein
MLTEKYLDYPPLTDLAEIGKQREKILFPKGGPSQNITFP